MNTNAEENPKDSSFHFGQVMTDPPDGEEICITGMSGVFPNSKNIQHYRDNLMEKNDMIDGDFRRWKPLHPEIPQRTGKIYDVEKFDAGFFGVHYRQAETMDAMSRIFLEKTYEAILDAGYNPKEFEGTKTGVFVGTCFGENEHEVVYDFITPEMFVLTGAIRSMIPNRVSYFLKLKGPSLVADTACSSSLYAFENAYIALRTGKCDMAIVGGANLCLHPFVSLQFARLGVLSEDGCCKSFDNSGNGYCRSEAINCVLLQKAKDARRIYAKVIHAKTSCDGYKEQGITYPSGDMQKRLLQEFYDECRIDPSQLSFLEAHGTGTKVGDPEEVTAIDEVFSPGRERPLLMGSVKSNLGHSEPASGICSIVKCVVGMEEGIIPPNLHYKTPREGIKALEEGRIKVVSEKTPFEDNRGLVGINSFGFGGGNCHILLKWNEKIKVNNSQPNDDLPRLVCLSGRIPEGVTTLIEDVNSLKLDAEYIQLLHDIFKFDLEGHVHRGFTVVSKKGMLSSSTKFYSGFRKHLTLTFGNFGNSYKDNLEKLQAIAIFNQTLKKINEILNTKKIDIFEMIQKNETNPSLQVFNHILGNVILQLGIIEILKELKIEPDFILGYALGEISCGYFDNCLSLEQAVLISFEIAEHLKNINKPSYVMVIEDEIEKVKKYLSNNTEIIWKNSEEKVTLSGEPKVMMELEKKLRKNEIKIEFISSNDVTIHSKDIASIQSSIMPKLKKIITHPKQRSNRWISISEEEVASPEYFFSALHSQINSKKLERNPDTDGIVLEIGTGQFSEILKHSTFMENNRITERLKFEENVQKNGKPGILTFLNIIGSLYEYGFNPQIQNLYPRLPYPVSRATPMISSKIKWNHTKDWRVLVYKEFQSLKSGERMFAVDVTQDEWGFVNGHVIDGRKLFPATGYLRLVWETLSMIKSMSEQETTVLFENVRFKRATPIIGELMDFDIMIQRNTGNFEIIESGVDIVSGKVRRLTEKEERKFAKIPFSVNDFEETLAMKTKDIYKELRLRGYNYQKAFKAMQECNCEATKAMIKWDGNWVAFMDNMLQISILQIDSRLLYVPTGIQRMMIDPKLHYKYVESFGDNPILPVYCSKEAGIIRCGGIEIRTLFASSITKRKQRGTPVLEKYVFVPNETKLCVEESLRVNMQMGLENLHGIKLKIVELLDDATKEGSEPLGPKIYDVFADLPLIQVNISVFSKEKLELDNVTVEDKELRTETDCNLIAGTNILQRATVLQQAFTALKDKAYILSREDPDFDISKIDKEDITSIDVLSQHDLGTEKLIFFRKKVEVKDSLVMKVSDQDDEFKWLSTLKTAMKKDKHIVLYAQNEPSNGLLGLYNCIRREPGGMNVRCFLIYGDQTPEFDINHEFYSKQFKKNMAINVYKNEKWGTYRHLLMTETKEIQSEHVFVNPLTRGDLSSLRWIEGKLSSKTILPPEKVLVNVHYASINFRDIMTATGRINADVITRDRIEQECVQGFEFSGRDPSGRRVMGIVVHGALSSLIEADSYLLIDVPDSWTLEQAASVPVVYATVIYAFTEVGKMKRGDTVLIHSGTGGIGQAAINFALSTGCTVFTTVGTPEKRELIKKLFPQLDDKHIGNSRDVSFEKMIYEMTGGRGVDFVLNSLAEEKLLASVRCLARGGRFLEIGKFDMANNHHLALKLFEKDCSFHGIMIDQYFTAHPSMRTKVNALLAKGVKDGFIKPLPTTTFEMSEIEPAFRHMVTGKHTGKIMIKIRDEKSTTSVETFKAVPRYTCDYDKCYIIIGGLGGFGLELADWLVLRGARRLILTSRTGISTGYQTSRLNTWKTYGTAVKISTADVTTEEGCEQLISEAEEFGPIETIFNLAVILKDALLENQTVENFQTSFGPKAVATMYLDKVTRKRCPNLRDFVVFSSVSCGRGNTGQTNYGMANSVMERICEQRKQAGFAALAIEWGAIGDVGLVAEMMEEHTEMEIGGTLQQKITSCLQVMDILLRQRESAIVSSMLVAEKRSGSGGADNIVDAVANILGIKKHSVSPHTTLSELGMDSMTAVEIKQTLEREFDVFLTAQDIRNLTFARLQEIQDEKDKERESGQRTQRLPRGFELILRYLGDEATSNIPFIRLPSLIEDDPADVPYIFCFPGVEGFAYSLKPLVANIKAKIIGVQFCYKNPTNTYKDLARESMEQIETFVTNSDEVHILSYSWGTIIALETLAMLEKKGYRGTITCVDGAPDMLLEVFNKEMKTSTSTEFETTIICHLMALYLPYEIILKSREKLYKCNTFDERVEVAQKISAHDATHSPEYQKKVAVGFHTRIKELTTYSVDYAKIHSKVTLFKPTMLSVRDFPEDYYLSKLCIQPVDVKVFEGNHITILENQSLADEINVLLGLAPRSLEDENSNEIREEPTQNDEK